MARNGSGTYARVHADYVTGTPILKDDINGELNDIASALTQSISKDGQTAYTANQPMGTFKFTNLGNGTAATDSIALRQVQQNATAYATDNSSAANTILLTLTPAIASYTTGMRITFIAAFTNTGAVQVNVNGVGLSNLTWPDSTALIQGDILINSLVEIGRVSGSWHLLSVNDPVTKHILNAKGDLFVYNNAAAVTRKGVGSAGSILISRSAETTGLAYVPALVGLIRGLTYQNNGSDATNDIDIAAGGCMDATGAEWIEVAALTKQSDATWAVGTNAGGLDTGVVGNSDYYIWAIKRSDTGVTDILFSLSSTAPTMPTNYNFKRLIGWFKRSGGTIVAFKTYETEGGGLEYLWSSPTLDVNLANTLTTSRRTDAVKVPLNVATTAILNVTISDAASYSIWIYCPDQADLAPGNTTTAPLANFRWNGGNPDGVQMEIRTSSTGTIAARSTLATVDQYSVATLGFKWSRR